jgi:hypothetical protein
MVFNFKKIASVASSGLMMMGTVALAAAANYPAPFVQNGNADVAIVVGESAAFSDNSAATALSTDLATTFAAQGGTSTQTVTTGEVFPLFTSSSEIYLNDSINTARSTLTDTDLPTVLMDGTFSGQDDIDYEQTIVLNGASRVLFDAQPDASDDDPTVYVSIGTSAGTHIYNSTIVFNQVVNFTHADSEGESLDLFGKEWTVGSDTSTTELVLYKSSERIALSLGGSSPTPSQTVTVDGDTYTIELISGDDNEATVKVTDSSGTSQTRTIDEDDSSTVNGLEVAIANTDESEAIGAISVEVTVGSDKITLQDGQKVEIGNDDDTLEGTTVDFIGNLTDGITQIRIQTFAEDNDNDAIVLGGSFVDPVWGSFKVDFTDLNAPLGSTTEREEISVQGAGDDGLSFTVTDHQDELQTLDFLNNESQSMRLAYGNSADEIIRVVEQAAVNESMWVILGNEDEAHLVELSDVTNSTAGNQYQSDVVRVRDMFSDDTIDATITADGVGTITVGGRTYDVTYSGANTAPAAITVRFNYPDSTSNNIIVFPSIETSKGANFALYEPTTITLNNFNGANGNVTGFDFPDGDGYTSVTIGRNITTDAGVWNFTFGSGSLQQLNTSIAARSVSGSIGRLTYNITGTGTAGQAKVYLVDPVSGGNILNPAFVLFEEEEDRNDNYDALIVTSSGSGTSDSNTAVSSVLSTRGISGAASGSYTELQSDDDLDQLLTYYGTLVTRDDSNEDQRSASISYPDDQAQAMIYFAEGEATIGGGGSSLGNIVVTDSQVATMSSKNLVVVGGSCINKVAARLLTGSDAAICGADFTTRTGVGTGSYLIQSFESPWSSSKVAVLVAGYTADDTTNAATALRTQRPDVAEGKKYTGSTATTLTPVTA